MLRDKVFLLLLGIFVFSFCQGQVKNTNFGKDSKVTLTEHINIFTTRLFLSWDGKEMFCWDNLNNTIKKFDFQKNIFYDVAKSELQVPQRYEEVVCVGRDSLFMYAWSDGYKANLLNGQGKLLRRYNLNPSRHANVQECDKNRVSYCNLRGTVGNTCFQGVFYYASHSMGEGRVLGKLFSGGKLDLSNGNVEYFTEYPNLYQKQNWGGMNCYFPFFTSNEKGLLVVSYPVSHNLYVYNLKTGEKNTVNAGSSLFRVVSPFPDKKIFKQELRDEYVRYFETNYFYGSITYDKKQKRYYRMVWHPNENYGKTAEKTRKKSIIVFDEEFNFIGEVLLPFDKNYYRLITTDYGVVVSFFDFKKRSYGFTVFDIVEL